MNRVAVLVLVLLAVNFRRAHRFGDGETLWTKPRSFTSHGSLIQKTDREVSDVLSGRTFDVRSSVEEISSRLKDWAGPWIPLERIVSSWAECTD